ncbi:MAG: bifunctional phosphopantothenoylcysteine decarboxylase/phosphopantothenate--cysteine ligase CoaBC [Parvibaculales bacterium]
MPRVLLIIGGGIAAYKAPELVRQLTARGLTVRCLLTAAAEQFVSPLSLAAVSGDKVYDNLFDLTDETEMGHIQLSRDADMILVAPATADLMAKAAQGSANDLATTTLLATDKPVMMAPAMNVRMWQHAATQRNLAQLQADQIGFIGPDEGDMACGEFGPGRMSDPTVIAEAVAARLLTSPPTATSADKTGHSRPLSGRKILVTAGPTHEPIDPVRYLANRSSGKQGYALAAALADLGADVVLVSGPTALNDPAGLTTIRVETAQEMLDAVTAQLPVAAAIMCAAVADWRPESCGTQKIKKAEGGATAITLTENPDILASLGDHAERPALLVGFAAETHNVAAYARDKLTRKNCDWIVANNVAIPADETDRADGQVAGGVMGSNNNHVTLVSHDGTDDFGPLSKQATAEKLADKIAAHLTTQVSTASDKKETA